MKLLKPRLKTGLINPFCSELKQKIICLCKEISVLSQLQRFCPSVAFIFATETLKHGRVASEARDENSKGTLLKFLFDASCGTTIVVLRAVNNSTTSSYISSGIATGIFECTWQEIFLRTSFKKYLSNIFFKKIFF